MIRGYDKSMKRHGAICDCSDNPGTVVDGSRLAEFCMLAHLTRRCPYSSSELYRNLNMGSPSQKTARRGF